MRSGIDLIAGACATISDGDDSAWPGIPSTARAAVDQINRRNQETRAARAAAAVFMHSPIQSRFAIASREATELYIATCSHTTEAHVSVEAQLLALLPMPGKQLKGSLPQGDHGIFTKQSCRARWSAMSSNQLS